MEKAVMPEKRYQSDDSRWGAVVNRDSQADGSFYYGVVTTGVYCRPGCVSRRPKRENVVRLTLRSVRTFVPFG